ncbi:MAG: AEC family transporter [Yoonia sp.]|uniref:AEC family transporter n=1 Tax=Rhodobacterales TaxID=204455 RepID=UPI001FF6A73F|nr:AEC family transporter [Loktanella sp. F6476L]MCK0121351.1 AEC family transporter [Loktanella sp. F6476L]UWQ99668.1 AEC family transporter [Rhodobacteraceae bacterium S2214]
MIAVFLQTLPFFGLIALGYAAVRTGFFSSDAIGHLTKFVFYFALPAMLLLFAGSLDLADVLDWNFVAAYFVGSFAIYALATLVSVIRGLKIAEAAIEAQCAIIGNVGFLGIPMLALLLGEGAIGPIMMILAVDLVFFGSLVVILITGSRDGRLRLGTLKTVAVGVAKNPMVVSIALGLVMSRLEIRLPEPAISFLTLLGAAATPGALFAIGGSLAGKSAERMSVAGWLTFCKLVLHPVAVGIAALFVFHVDPIAAGMMIATAALPVAGNVYIIAQHYAVAPARVSAAILVSTVLSILTIPFVIGWVTSL